MLVVVDVEKHAQASGSLISEQVGKNPELELLPFLRQSSGPGRVHTIDRREARGTYLS